MEYVTAEVKVSKEAYALGKALGKLAVDAKKALADGAQASDLPVLLADLMSKEFAEAMMGISQLGEEMKADKIAFIGAFTVAAVQVAESL